MNSEAFERAMRSYECFHGLRALPGTWPIIRVDGRGFESDETSVLLPRDTDLFDRSLEKLVPVSAAIASATFTQELGSAAHFDGRLWLGPSHTAIIDHFRWRQADATRNALNAWSYWTLRRAGKSMADATKALHGAPVGAKNALLFRHGINFNDVPTWHRRGTGLYWHTFAKEGRDPRTGRIHDRDTPGHTSGRRPAGG